MTEPQWWEEQLRLMTPEQLAIVLEKLDRMSARVALEIPRSRDRKAAGGIFL